MKLKTLLCSTLFFAFCAKASWKNLETFMFGAPRNAEALIVAKDSKILYENYAPSYNAQTPHLLWSASKSLLSLLVGHAVYEGKLKVEDSICQYLSELKGNKRCQIKIRDLLEFGSGLDWEETYEKSPTESSVVDMLFHHGRSNMARYVLKKKVDIEAGTRWQYSTGDTILLSYILSRVYGQKEYANLPFKFFNEELGLKSFVAESDPSGTFIAGSFFYLSPHDTLKLGQKLIKKYKNPFEPMSIPNDWLRNSWAIAENFKYPPANWDSADISGWHWWINTSVEKWKLPLPYPNAPKDLVMAQGHWGQLLAIVPSENLVVVKFANQRDGINYIDELFKEIHLALNPKYKSLATPKYQSLFPLKKFHFPNPLDKWHLLKIAQAYESRLFCSCHFVMKQSLEYCTQYVHDDRVPSWVLKLNVDQKEKRIRAHIGFSTISARYLNERDACRFEN